MKARRHCNRTLRSSGILLALTVFSLGFSQSIQDLIDLETVTRETIALAEEALGDYDLMIDPDGATVFASETAALVVVPLAYESVVRIVEERLPILGAATIVELGEDMGVSVRFSVLEFDLEDIMGTPSIPGRRESPLCPDGRPKPPTRDCPAPPTEAPDLGDVTREGVDAARGGIQLAPRFEPEVITVCGAFGLSPVRCERLLRYLTSSQYPYCQPELSCFLNPETGRIECVEICMP